MHFETLHLKLCQLNDIVGLDVIIGAQLKYCIDPEALIRRQIWHITALYCDI